METKMDVLNIVLISLAFLAPWVMVYSRRSRRPGGGLPPGPPRLPIFGNIFQLGRNPHKSLSQLAKTYGPLMSLKLGTQTAVVVSSAEMAREVLQRQGHVLSKAFIPDVLSAHGHDHYSILTLPSSSDRWKKLRRLSVEKLFSNQALQASKDLRHQSYTKLIDHVSASCGAPINVGEATFSAMSGLLFATVFSDSGSGLNNKKLKEHVNAVTRYMGVPNISDFFPVFAPLDPQGLRRKIAYHLGSVLEIVGAMIEHRLQQRKDASSSSNNYQNRNIGFLETLLDLTEGDEFDLSIEEIKHLCMDLIGAGSETSSAAAEWAMVELLLHPDKMAKVKSELKSVVGERRIIKESDISRLPYLQATIKESLRFHPVGPLLAPHAAEEETQINGYRIPKDTKMMVNFWAITRDASIWKDPECFEPDRFLGKDIDFQGRHFELIPFGSGRRICPAISLAALVLPCMVATLCHNFDWELEEGSDSKSLQREDVFGLALQKKHPLMAIAIKVFT